MNQPYNIIENQRIVMRVARISSKPYLQGISLIYYSQGSLNGYGHSELD